MLEFEFRKMHPRKTMKMSPIPSITFFLGPFKEFSQLKAKKNLLFEFQKHLDCTSPQNLRKMPFVGGKMHLSG